MLIIWCNPGWIKLVLRMIEETAIRMGSQVDEIDKQVPLWQEVDRQ